MNIQKLTKKQLIDQIEELNAKINQLSAKDDDYKQVNFSSPTDRCLFNEAHMKLCITDFEGHILFANKAMEQAFGFSRPELEKMKIADLLVASDHRDRIVDLFNKKEAIQNFEIGVKKKEGGIITALINTKPIDLDGTKAVLTSIYDITQYKRIQKELVESEDQYQVLFKNVPVGITVTNYIGNIINSNQAMQEMTGYSEEELNNMNVLNLYMNKAQRKEFLDSAEKDKAVRDFEAVFRHKNGHAIPVLINTDMIEYNKMEKIFLNSIRDITNLIESEDELKRQRDFTNTILDTADSLIFVLDREGRITRFNKECEKKSGNTFEEVQGQYIWEVISREPEEARKRVSEILMGNYPIKHESLWVNKAGGERLISWTSTVLLDDQNNAEYIIATGIDITERRLAETELKEANEKLAGWVDELKYRTEEMQYLSDMGEQLQSCQAVEEVCAISKQFIRLMCPACRGAIYLINSSKDLAEAVEIWGDPAYTDEVFLPSRCWSIRRNRPHLVDQKHPGLLCGHISGPQEGEYLCVPMMAHGETIGILHINHGGDEMDRMEQTIQESRMKAITEVADHIALALSNLKLREALRQQSIRDILTGLYNRRYMEETLMRELNRAERDKHPVGIIMFDIDHFKNFNDLVGHDGGDALLRELGAFLLKNIRGGDIICRYGGEEFVAVLPGANAENTRKRAEELREGVKGLLVYHLGKPLSTCTISLGVSAYPDNGKTIEELLKNADNALYKAKKGGRDRVVVAPIPQSRQE